MTYSDPGSTTTKMPPDGSSVGGDIPSGAPSAPYARPNQRTARGSQYSVNEVMGDTPTPTQGPQESAGLHGEVASGEGAEAGEEYIEASPDQLSRAAESGEESAFSDLRGIEGFELPSSVQEGAETVTALRDAGSAIEGAADQTQEFLPIVAALAPALISAVGPSLARALKSKLSRRAMNVIKTIPRPTTLGGKVAAGGKGQILALIAKLLERAETAPGGESGMEVEESLVDETAMAIEAIIGVDQRVRIMATTQVPWRRICALRIVFPSGATYRGTGFLIGPRAVATAGHCVYLHNQGGWARKIDVTPGANDSAKPFGLTEATQFRSVGGWVNDRKPESDYGCIILPNGAFSGRNLGSFGFAAFESPQMLAQPAVLGGYPGDKPFAQLWGMAQVIKAVTAKTLVYEIDTMGGQSGAPVYIVRNGNRYVVGIHNYGGSTANYATRVTQPVYERLKAWSLL